MRKITKLTLIGTFLCAGSIAQADAPEPVSDRWESDAARTVSLNATYIVGGILVAFLLVNAINDADSDE
jgi:hypothetical protein